MERAAIFLSKMKGADQASNDELARAVWQAAVGKRLASRTRASRLVRDRLVVEVEDHIWQTQLFSMRLQILAKMRKVTGQDWIRDIEFRIVPSRMPVKTALLRTARPTKVTPSKIPCFGWSIRERERRRRREDYRKPGSLRCEPRESHAQ